MTTIGLISDTHGLLRAEALSALAGVDLILHAGDMGDEAVIAKLAELAPVFAVRGNIDRLAWAHRYPIDQVLEVENVFIYLHHGDCALDLDPVAAGFQVVASGHSHEPLMETQQGVLYINPGSAGPKRFSLSVSLAKLTVEGSRVSAELITLPATERVDLDV